MTKARDARKAQEDGELQRLAADERRWTQMVKKIILGVHSKWQERYGRQKTRMLAFCLSYLPALPTASLLGGPLRWHFERTLCL